jgi:DNA polymerase-3 subunit beta
VEFAVKKSSLQKELGFVQGVIEKKNTIPVLQNLLVRSQGEDKLEIVATDLDLSIRCLCDVEIKQPGSMLIQARKLFDIVRSLPDAEVTIKKDGTSHCALECERSKFRITGQSEENFPDVPEMNATKASFATEALLYFIEHSIFAIKQEESQRYSLNGAQFFVNQQLGRMVTTDGHRLAFVEKRDFAPDILEEVKVLIPRKTLSELVKMLGDSSGDRVTFSWDENHLFFGVGQRTLISRTLSGQFPNYELVMPKETNVSILFDTDQLYAGVRRVALMADERTRGVKVRFQNSKAEIRSQSSEMGEATETIPIDYEGEEASIGFNSQYLTEFLQSVKSGKVYFEFRDVQSQAQFRPQENGDYDYRYILMPMRI